MIIETQEDVTKAVLAEMHRTPDPRTKEILEALVRHLLEHKDVPATARSIDPNIRHLQDDLSRRLGARVEIRHGAGGKGKLVLAYNSLDELDGILSHIK